MDSDNPSTPGSFPGLDSVLGIASRLSRVIPYKGRDYELKELTLEQSARYSAFLKRRAKLEAAAECEFLSEDAKAALMRGVMESIAIGNYEPGSSLFMLSMKNPHCIEELFYIMFHDEDESFTYDDAKGLLIEHGKTIAAEFAKLNEPLKN